LTPTEGRIDSFRFAKSPPEEHEKTEPFRVPRFHRTLSGWVELIVEAGLVIERFGEPRVSVEVARAEPALEDTLVAPLFLHIRAIKPLTPDHQASSINRLYSWPSFWQIFRQHRLGEDRPAPFPPAAR
jgi:hypothetical protein